MKPVRDPNGVELERTVLQITGRDESGRVTTCRAWHDEETIDLTEAGPNGREFLIVWVAKRPDRAFRLSTEIPEEAELADLLRESVANLKQARAEIKTTRDLLDRVTEDNRAKTDALRRLQDERDPHVIDRRVAEAVARATEGLEEDVKNYRMRLAVAEREIDELRASKKKLRDALERAKEGRR